MARYQCQNCQEIYKLEELKPVQDLEQRVSPGEPMPAGECPSMDCGAVCHEYFNEGVLTDMECKQCGAVGPFKIEVKVLRIVHDDGDAEDDPMSGDTEWVNDDYCECKECGHSGKVKDFMKKAPVSPEKAAARAGKIKQIADIRAENFDLRDYLKSWHTEALNTLDRLSDTELDKIFKEEIGE